MGWPMTTRGIDASWQWTADDLAALPGWRLRRGGSGVFARVSIDSRESSLEGALYVAIRGERHDGHVFVQEAIAKGAAGVVVAEDAHLAALGPVTVCSVPDTLRALGQLANLRRRAFRGPVVALTGSAGKSSTKTFLGAALGRRAFVNPGNLNNRVGVPLSIFQAPLDAAAWVLELGMNEPGEIAALRDIVEADLGILLPAGTAHVGRLGSPEAVLAAKAELAEGASAPSRWIVADRRYLSRLEGGDVETVGMTAADPIRILSVRERFPEGMVCRVATHGGRVDDLQTGLHGRHWAVPVATAWAAARVLGVEPAVARRRLAGCPAPAGRMALSAHLGGWILDDSYNASPESMDAFVDWLESLQGRLRTRVVLGDMRELGALGAEIHERVARRVRALGADRIDVVGDAFAAAFAAEGGGAVVHKTPESALAAAFADWRPGTLLAVKGANASGLYVAMGARKGRR